TTFGANLAAQVASVDVDIRLGWLHEYADVARPMTASFAGAPGAAFTVFGATPQRDSAAIGFAARTHIAEHTPIYARYDGGVGGGPDNDALTAGLRMTWRAIRQARNHRAARYRVLHDPRGAGNEGEKSRCPTPSCPSIRPGSLTMLSPTKRLTGFRRPSAAIP